MHKMINPSFTRGEYWLLETVAEFSIPICWLIYQDIEEALNKQSHGMDRSLLVDTMYKLFSDGLIVAHKIGQLNDCSILTSEQIDRALHEKRDMNEHYFRLTKKGGELWEAFASPRWKFFISGGFELTDDSDICIGDLTCMDRRHLEGYFRSLSYYNYEVDGTSIEWDIVRPWEATYWKELQIGHRVRFRCKEKKKKMDPNIPSPINHEWYDKLWYHWR